MRGIRPSSNTISRFPTTEDMKLAMEVGGGSIEGAQHFQKQMMGYIKDNPKLFSKSPELKDNIIGAVDKYVKYVEFKHKASNQSWNGIVEEKGTYQEDIAKQVAENLTDKVTKVGLDYAISKEGHYMRGYSSGSGTLESGEVTSLDRLFNAWLASKNYSIKGGYLSDNSTNTQLSADEVQALINDGTLEVYMEDKGVEVTRNARAYPGEELEVKEVAKAKEDIEKAVQAAREAEAEMPEPEDQTPSNEAPGGSMG